MTPAEVSALLRIKQVREQRARATLDAAKRRHDDAASRKQAAEQANQAFAAEAQERQRAAFEAMDGAEHLSAAELQAVSARLGGMRVEAARLQKGARDAAIAEQRQGREVAAAAAAHGVAMRGAEAFDALKAEVVRAAGVAADRGEEAETEEPRPAARPTSRPGR